MFSMLCYGQNNSTLNIEYSYSTKLEGTYSRITINSTLIANQIHSIYEMNFNENNKETLSQESGEEGTVYNIKSKVNPKIYKDLKSKNIYSVELIGLKPFIVRDTMAVFKWNFLTEYKSILGYKCQKANVNYRGRDYVAYFTTELPFNAGPWKFSGLPGVILEVASLDNVFEIKANKIQLKNEATNLHRPNLKNLSITWNDYIKEYNKKYNELLYYTSPNGGTSSLPKRQIEVLVEE
ncbi:GLPGLI family protein [Ichthyenterobacterium magnum]|uniref:GLPGLI family protein n=2 Tax=Ichthyenterobacterium magnum TaxID=1230530 RepID=A0A420DXE5_9FLAO|nr:GLPGLI family protein [Ichthyenterobacterium magnum]